MMRSGTTLPSAMIVVLGMIIVARIIYASLSHHQPLFPYPRSAINSPSPIISEVNSKPISNWATYRNEEYDYEIQYPSAEGWYLTADPSIGQPSLPYFEPIHVATLYSFRQSENIYIIVTVYASLPTSQLKQWLSQAVPGLLTIEDGDINKALTKAYSGTKGIFNLLTYTDYQVDSFDFAELGATVALGGKLSYTKFISQGDAKDYVYSIELLLPFDQRDTEPADAYYVETFEQVVSSFKKTE